MLNNVSIMGRLVRDPELKTAGQNGASVVRFTIAVDRNFKGKNEADKQADFFDCVAWRQTAEFVDKYFSKGNLIIVNGELQTRTWDSDDGVKRKATEILARNVYFGGGKSGNEGKSTARQSDVTDDSDFPF